MSTVATRRGFLLGLGAALAAPAVVRSGLLMPVKALVRAPTTLWVGTDFVGLYKQIESGTFYQAVVPYSTLAAALADSVPGDTIQVAAGHVETVPPEGFFLPANITLIGGHYRSHEPNTPLFTVNDGPIEIRNTYLEVLYV